MRDPQGHEGKLVYTPTTATSSSSRHVPQTNGVKGTSRKMSFFHKAAHQELQDPVHLEVHNLPNGGGGGGMGPRGVPAKIFVTLA